MRAINVLISSIHLVVLLFTLSLGVSFIYIGVSSSPFEYFLKSILENNQILFKIGLLFLIISFLLFISFYWVYKNQYLKISMKKNRSEINTKLINSYIENYLKTSYPKDILFSEVNLLKDNKLEIIAHMKKLSSIHKKDILLSIEEKIGKLLLEHLQYEKEFIFTLNIKK